MRAPRRGPNITGMNTEIPNTPAPDTEDWYDQNEGEGGVILTGARLPNPMQPVIDRIEEWGREHFPDTDKGES